MPDTTAAPSTHKIEWRLVGTILAALAASMMNSGLVRFAYTALVPSLISAKWFKASDVIWIAAANLAGYMLGAILGRPAAQRIGGVWALRLMDVFTVISLLACAFPISVPWFFAWRLISGIAGGATIVLVASTVMPLVSPKQRGLVAGFIFLGIGLGIVISGIMLPVLKPFGLQAVWLGFFALCAVMTLATWLLWPKPDHPAAIKPATTNALGLERAPAKESMPNEGAYYLQVLLFAILPVATMVFIVNYLVKDMHQSLLVASGVWILYGLGATIGPVIYGHSSDHYGLTPTIRWSLLLQIIGIAVLIFCNPIWGIAIDAVILGSWISGVIPLLLGWVHHALPGRAEKGNIIWSHATIIFSGGQAITGIALSALLNANGGNHRQLFETSLVAAVLALVANLIRPMKALPAPDRHIQKS